MLVVTVDRGNKPKTLFLKEHKTPTNPTRQISILLWYLALSRHTICDASNNVRKWDNFLTDILLKLTSDHKFREGLGSRRVCSRDTLVSSTVIVLRMLDCELSIL